MRQTWTRAVSKGRALVGRRPVAEPVNRVTCLHPPAVGRVGGNQDLVGSMSTDLGGFVSWGVVFDTATNGGNVGQREVAVVLEHDYRALLGAQPFKGTVELLMVRDGDGRIGLGAITSQEVERRRLATLLAQGVVAGANEDPVRPGLDEVGFPERGEYPPDAKERHLERVAGGVEVAQDPMRNREEAVAQLEGEAGECLPVASLRPLHQGPFHRSLRGEAILASLTRHGVRSSPNGSILGSTRSFDRAMSIARWSPEITATGRASRMYRVGDRTRSCHGRKPNPRGCPARQPNMYRGYRRS